MYDNFKYVGFNREDLLDDLRKKGFDKKLIVEIIIACAIRGPTKAVELKLSNGKTIREMGVPASGMKSKKGVSCARINAATADLAAYFLKRLDFPKRIPELDCPGWLQFPSAGGIKLPENLRLQHKKFSIEFSQRIRGGFDESIYQAMTLNAYLDPKLKLFEGL